MKSPGEIRIDAVARTLTLHWPDNGTQQLTHLQLRRACPCAGCRRIRLAGRDVEAPQEIALTDIQAMGYGVQLFFSDGHDRGIYPWLYLEQMGAFRSSVRCMFPVLTGAMRLKSSAATGVQ